MYPVYIDCLHVSMSRPIDNLDLSISCLHLSLIHLYQYVCLIISICQRFRPKSLAVLDPAVPKPETMGDLGGTSILGNLEMGICGRPYAGTRL